MTADKVSKALTFIETRITETESLIIIQNASPAILYNIQNILGKLIYYETILHQFSELTNEINATTMAYAQEEITPDRIPVLKELVEKEDGKTCPTGDTMIFKFNLFFSKEEY